MLKNILTLTVLFSTSILNSQTKSIAYKRHHGQSVHFSNSLKLEGIEGGTSNFGAAPERWIRNSELKKVIFINDSTSVMVTEETCRNEYSYKQQETEKWRAGSDTLTRHPVFSAPISVDSMRTILKSDYYFANDMKNVQFEGFEKRNLDPKKVERREKIKSQVWNIKNKKEIPSRFEKYTWLTLLLASSLGVGLIKLR